ncbi:MAG TPA: hypothetical protein PKA28_15145 [Methylomusa anaerophila]|uniref:CAAX amino terminal protease self-immunity n=1 Tax=Methylomusa anaerophila TaxID=1930071 RepID=A0A348AJI1_9FIRM|nr:hypothetical protein [Methylomusa anaerophila]BBB91229.1 hypothetical protein MAMMFC1_01900 [Methylomusa anaerophila]HML89777.1 hypothetical protein [Methylomusa anaerophila]
MAYVIGCLMAALSFLINRALLLYIGPVVVVGLSPIMEETAKTLLAYWLKADILVTHITFGIIEAVYDWHHSRKSGLTAGFMSILGHSFFGAVTTGILLLSGNIFLGLVAGMAVHLAWNATVIRLISSK